MSAPSSPGATSPPPDDRQSEERGFAAFCETVEALEARHAQGETLDEIDMAVMTRGRSAITGYMFGADIADGKMPNAETVYSSEQDRSRHQARTAVVRRRYQRDDGTWHSATHSAATIAVGTIAVRTRARRRGAGRPAARSGGTSTSSQDPGSGSDEPEPPDSGRLCAAPWCRHHVDGTRKVYCGTERCTQARAAERQRKHRNGDLTPVELERLADARLAGYVGGEAFAKSGEHSRSFLWKFGLLGGDDPGEFGALLDARACRCNGSHIDGGVVGCFKCGSSRVVVAV